MGILTLALIAVLYLLSALLFGWERNGPQALMCAGALLILIGQIWQVVKQV